MRSSIYVFLTSLFVFSFVNQPVGASELNYSLNQLLQTYSQLNKTEFVISDLVEGHATIEGIEEKSISGPLVASILEVHGYAAIEKEGKIHIVPNSASEGLLRNGGEIWIKD